MMKKRLVALLAAVCLLAGMCAVCGAEGGVDTETVEIFTVLELGGLSYDLNDMDDPVGKAITEKTGVKLVFEYPVGDWNEKLALIIAGEDYPDMIGNEGNSMAQLIEAGAAVPLREKIENSPNISAYLDDMMPRLTYSLEDPEFYGFGSARMIDDPKPDDYWNLGAAVQFGVLKEAGWPMLNSLEDFEKIVSEYKEANPTSNDQPSIGISLVAADGWRWKITVTNPATILSGKPDDGEWYIDPETFEATAHYKNTWDKEYFKWLNHVNDIGLLDPESFTQSYDAYQAKIASGRVIGLIDCLWEYDIARREAVANYGDESDYMAFPVLMDPENTTWTGERSSGYVNSGGYTVTKNCKNVDKLVNFFDFIASEEGQILRKWGIEGEHYTVEDGQLVRVPEIKAAKLDPTQALTLRKETGIGKYDSALLYSPGYGWKLSNGQMLDDYDDQEYYESRTGIYKEALEAYDLRGFNMLFPAASTVKPSEWGAAWTLTIGQTEESKVILQKYEDITLKNVARAVLAKPEDFDAEWDKFMKELDDINIELVQQEVTSLVDERMQLWGYK